MKNKTRILLSLMLAALLMPGLAIYASAGGQVLPRGFIIADSDGIQADPVSGEYYVLVEHMIPEKTYTKQIQIQNTRPDKAFHIYMRVEPVSKKGNVDMNKEVNLTLSLDGSQFYSGNPSGIGNINMQNYAVDLGIFPTGCQRVIDMTAYLNKIELDGKYSGEVVFKWIFTAAVAVDPTSTTQPTGTVPTTAAPAENPTSAPATEPTIAPTTKEKVDVDDPGIPGAGQTTEPTAETTKFIRPTVPRTSEKFPTVETTSGNNSFDPGDDGWLPPKTGDRFRLWLYALGGASAAAIALVLFAGRRRKKRDDNDSSETK